jgi:hypothetical protein
VIRGGRPAGLAAAALVVAAVILGAIGVDRAFPRDSPSDVAFRTVQLFFAEVGPPDGGTPWQLDVARFLAPLALVVAALLAFLALAQRQALTMAARLLGRGRLAILGLGPVASVVARSAPRRPFSVLVLCQAGLPAPLDRFRHRWWPVVAGDLDDVAFLQSLRLERSGHIVIATGDDSLNLRALAACRRVVGNAESAPRCHVEIADPALWRELHLLAFNDDATAGAVEVFNPADRVARNHARRGSPA